MIELEVGKKFPVPFQPGIQQTKYAFNASGHNMILFLPNPNDAEIYGVRKADMQLGLFVKDELILMLYRFGKILSGEAPYSWHMVPEENRTLPDVMINKNQRYLLHIMLVDSATGLLQANRIVSMSHEFTGKLHDAIRLQSLMVWDQDLYNQKLINLFNVYSTKELFYKASAKCFGGD